MRKLIAILSALGLTATSSSAVVSCGFSQSASIGGGATRPDATPTNAVDPSDVDVDNPTSIQAFKDGLKLSGKTLADWNGNYQTYSGVYSENLSAYEENKNYDYGDHPSADEKNEQKTMMQMELAYMSMYKVLKSYSLAKLFILWNGLNVDVPNFNNMTVPDLKSVIMQFYDIQVATLQWKEAYKNLKKNFLTEKDEKLVWGIVDDTISGWYVEQATALVKAANAVLLVKALNPNDKLYLTDIIAGNYLKFDDDFDNEIKSGETTSAHVSNVKDISKYKIDESSISVYDFNGKKLTDHSGVKLSLDAKTNSIVCETSKDIKNEYHITFKITGDELVLQVPPRELSEYITFMVI